MCTFCNKTRYFILSQKMNLKSLLLRLGCYFYPSWHYIDNDCICTSGKVLKLNKIYSFIEGEAVDIVRLNDVHLERGFLYCSLFFFSRNKIKTVRQTMLKSKRVSWRLLDNEEFDEIMSRRLWQEVSDQNELLDIDFKS